MNHIPQAKPQQLDEEWKKDIDPWLLSLSDWERDPNVLALNELAGRMRGQQVWFAAPVQLFRVEKRWVWLVLVCPGCGGKHEHDGGDLDSDPRLALTLVDMACDLPKIGWAARDWGYMLCAEDPKDVASVLREVKNERIAEAKA